MENTKQTIQEMREELVNHFKYLGEIREACNPEHLESLTDAMLKIYDVLSNDNNNERELYCFKEDRGQNIEKPLEHGEGGQGQTPKDLSKWADRKVDRTIVIRDDYSITTMNGCVITKTDKEGIDISIQPNREVTKKEMDLTNMISRFAIENEMPFELIKKCVENLKVVYLNDGIIRK